jgi:hypothetical protein
MPLDQRVFGLALLNHAANIICRVMDDFGDRILPFLDPLEAAAFLTLKAACEEWKKVKPISD